VVAFDYDSKAIDLLYEYIKNHDTNILPLYIDIMRPTPAYGPDLSTPSIFNRLRCDYVLAFAISHHLAKNYSLRVEYIDPKDMHMQNWIRKGWKVPSWYTEKKFVNAFLQYFFLERAWETAFDDVYARKLFYFKRTTDLL
jgi:hypothetical protein